MGDQFIELFTADFALPARNVNVTESASLSAILAAMAASSSSAERGYRYDQECPPARECNPQQMVEIIAAERGITAGRQHFNTPRLKRRMEISNVPPPRS